MVDPVTEPSALGKVRGQRDGAEAELTEERGLSDPEQIRSRIALIRAHLAAAAALADTEPRDGERHVDDQDVEVLDKHHVDDLSAHEQRWGW